MSEVKPSEYGLIECADGLKRMGEVKGGGWYRASDYDALAAECERLLRMNKWYEATLTRVDNMWKKRWLEKTGEPAVALIVDEEFKHYFEQIKEIRTERDAALAERAALKCGQEAVAWAVCREPGKVDALSAAYASESAAKAHVNSYATKGCSGLHVTPLYTALPAQASAWLEATEAMVMAARGVCVSFRGHYGEHNDYLDDCTARQIIEAALSAHKTGEEDNAN